MPEIKREYPEGKRSIEMLLVSMLIDKRSWADYMQIERALWNIRLRAKQMEKEGEMLASNQVTEDSPKAATAGRIRIDN